MLKNAEQRFYSMIEKINEEYRITHIKVIFNYGRNLTIRAKEENIQINFSKIEEELKKLSSSLKEELNSNLIHIKDEIENKNIIDMKLIPFEILTKEDIIDKLNKEYDIYYNFLIKLKELRTFIVNESEYFDEINIKQNLIESLIHNVLFSIEYIEKEKNKFLGINK